MSAPHGDGQQLVEQLGLFCQRWTRRRVSYRPAGEIFDPRFVSVEPIEESAAKAFIEAHHYSASYPAARFRAGVLVKEPFRKEVFAGVGVFSAVPTPTEREESFLVNDRLLRYLNRSSPRALTQARY